MEPITKTTTALDTMRQGLSADSIINAIAEGDINPLSVWTAFKQAAQVFEQIQKSPAVRVAMSTELDKYGKEGATVNGFRVYMKGGARKYDFSECNCSKWATLKAIEKNAADERKMLEKMLIALKAPVSDIETGELLQPATLIPAADVIVCDRATVI